MAFFPPESKIKKGNAITTEEVLRTTLRKKIVKKLNSVRGNMVYRNTIKTSFPPRLEFEKRAMIL